MWRRYKKFKLASAGITRARHNKNLGLLARVSRAKIFRLGDRSRMWESERCASSFIYIFSATMLKKQ